MPADKSTETQVFGVRFTDDRQYIPFLNLQADTKKKKKKKKRKEGEEGAEGKKEGEGKDGEEKKAGGPRRNSVVKRQVLSAVAESGLVHQADHQSRMNAFFGGQVDAEHHKGMDMRLVKELAFQTARILSFLNNHGVAHLAVTPEHLVLVPDPGNLGVPSVKLHAFHWARRIGDRDRPMYFGGLPKEFRNPGDDPKDKPEPEEKHLDDVAHGANPGEQKKAAIEEKPAFAVPACCAAPEVARWLLHRAHRLTGPPRFYLQNT